MKVYVVLMQRWGDEEGHHYITGVYTSEYQARLHGEHEQEWRANKYTARLVEMTLDESLFFPEPPTG
jgi:hypothetical protein